MRLVNSLVTRFGTLALAGYIAWSGWTCVKPEKPQLSTIRRDLADNVISTVVEDVRRSRGDIRQAVLLHFANDPTDHLTNGLRRAIEQSGILDLRDRTIPEKVRNLLNLRHPSLPSPDAMIEWGKHAGVAGVLYGVVYACESYPGGAKVDVEVHLADVAAARNIFSKRYQIETPSNSALVAAVEGKARMFPWFQRIFGWLLAVLLLPVFTINFMRAMLRQRSNRANAFVLTIYTLADALLAWLLVGAALNSWWTASMFLLAVGVAFAYNVWIMTFALRLEA